MTPEEKPAAVRRRLQRELVGMREAAGLTQLQVARELHISQSKVNRIESGEVGLSQRDLLRLLQLYRRDDEETVGTMTRMASVARRPSLPEVADLYPERAFRRYLELEGLAARIDQFENAAVPGLLQTPEYTTALLENGYRLAERPRSEVPAIRRRIQAKVDFRSTRQRIFDPTEPAGPTGRFVLDEAVIRRRVGAEAGRPAVMAGQLRHLKELSRNDRVEICVVPFSAGANAGMAGPFVLLGFADPGDAPLLYLENALDDFVTTEDRGLIGRFRATFDALRDAAVWGAALDALLDDAIAALD